MRFVHALTIAVIAASSFLGTAQAQDEEKLKLKKEIMEKVKELIQRYEKDLVDEIEKFVDTELAKIKPAKKDDAKKDDTKKDDTKKDNTKKDDAKSEKPWGFLGIKSRPLNDSERDENKLKEEDGGLKILEVVSDSPAQKAGLEADDILLDVNGKAITDPRDLAKMVMSLGAGAEVKLTVLRDGKKKNFNVTLGKHPEWKEPEKEKDGDKKDNKKGGVSKEDLKERLKKFLDEKKDDTAKKPHKTEGDEDENESDLSRMFKNLDPDSLSNMLEQASEYLKQMGIDPDQFLEKDKDGKYKLPSNLQDMLKNFNMNDLMKQLENFQGNDMLEKLMGKQGEDKETAPAKGPGFLGIAVKDITDSKRADLDIEAGVGVQVDEIQKNSPAEKAGLRKGDIVTHIDGKAIASEEHLSKFMTKAKAGQKISVKARRGHDEKVFEITLGVKKD